MWHVTMVTALGDGPGSKASGRTERSNRGRGYQEDKISHRLDTTTTREVCRVLSKCCYVGIPGDVVCLLSVQSVMCICTGLGMQMQISYFWL